MFLSKAARQEPGSRGVACTGQQAHTQASDTPWCWLCPQGIGGSPIHLLSSNKDANASYLLFKSEAIVFLCVLLENGQRKALSNPSKVHYLFSSFFSRWFDTNMKL